MRALAACVLAGTLSACVTPPAPPEVQAAHFGAVLPAPSVEELEHAVRIENYVWRTRPRSIDYVMVYPRNAWYAEVEGWVVLNCIARSDGQLACAAKDDGMPSYDFEQAALNLSTLFRLEPLTRDGAPVAGKRMVLSIQFRFSDW